MLILISIFHLGTKPSIRVALYKYKSSRAGKNGPACHTIAASNAKKTDITYNLFKTKTNHLLCLAHHATVGEVRRGGCIFVENRVIIVSFYPLIQKNRCPVSLRFLTALFRWVLHCSLSHVYWPKPQCEIQNNCSPQLPWHSLAHCDVLFSSSRKSNWDRNFQK